MSPDLEKFLGTVQLMRQYQKKYFTTRSPDALHNAKVMESVVDGYINSYYKMTGSLQQGELSEGKGGIKKCPVDENCIALDTMEELLAAFQVLAGDEELTDDTVVEGNSGLKFGTVKKWTRYFGVGNVYFKDSFPHGFVDEFYFDLKNTELKGLCWLPSADEIYIEDGFLRIWFD